MALTQRLEFRQSQSLVMTPQLMQAIKLLQLSNLDLVAFVEDELERNPLLFWKTVSLLLGLVAVAQLGLRMLGTGP
jgi:DNA-directed RNA polymerase specialized sigma54-like protein